MSKTVGPFYKQLEQKYAKFVGSNYAVSVNTGTAALHLALLAVGVKKGDEVIIPDFTMAACAFAVSYIGAKPVFIDCKDDLTMNEKLIEAKITKKTKAIMPVHIYGRLCNMPAILKIAKKYNLAVVEDACEAQGAVYDSKADITCYSFYANKIIHAEEGGICTTNNANYAEKIAYLKNMAFGDKHDYFHSEIGFNYRMPESQAKLALQSLKDIGKNLKKRRKWEGKMRKIWQDNMPVRNVVWVYDIVGAQEPYDFYGEIRPFFKPISSFPMYGGKCQSPKAELYSKNGFYIKYPL